MWFVGLLSPISPGREGDSVTSAYLGDKKLPGACKAKQTARLPAPRYRADPPGAGGQERSPLLIWMLLSLRFGCFLMRRAGK